MNAFDETSSCQEAIFLRDLAAKSEDVGFPSLVRGVPPIHLTLSTYLGVLLCTSPFVHLLPAFMVWPALILIDILIVMIPITIYPALSPFAKCWWLKMCTPLCGGFFLGGAGFQSSTNAGDEKNREMQRSFLVIWSCFIAKNPLAICWNQCWIWDIKVLIKYDDQCTEHETCIYCILVSTHIWFIINVTCVNIFSYTLYMHT